MTGCSSTPVDKTVGMSPNKIYAEAYSKDPEFFQFYRSMQAYEKGLKSTDTRLMLSPDSTFFKYFADPNGRAPAAPATPAPR